ncbi:hypothetical protein GOBAR_AA37537 [Gossypium barbadense]|uniref:P-type ATPase C-terminal domain-containing protein n=1 Tax=Gossypium barbadense TaxID=3634 RepID=A0A2P5VWG7_GOSBA|nr:hypothetical protein GOBAR_AA37537 [Gossypium barbadense]
MIFSLCKVVMYFFYKNLAFTLTQFWFTFGTGFSGQRFYDDWFQSLYNVIFTALPVVIVGLFDQDISSSLSKKYPELYKEGVRNMFFNRRIVAIWACFAVYQSLVFFYFVSLSSSTSRDSDGKMFGLWDVSTMAFTCVVVTVNLRLLMMCNSITRWHYISVGGSIIVWFVFIFIYSGIMTRFDRNDNMFWVIYVLMSTSYFYVTLLLVPVAALLGDFLYLGVQRWFFPYDYQIVQESHKDDADSINTPDSQETKEHLTPDEARSNAISQLPKEVSKHSGFAFDSPGYESFFATQFGKYVPPKAWDQGTEVEGYAVVEERWQLPDTGWIKINSDATLQSESSGWRGDKGQGGSIALGIYSKGWSVRYLKKQSYGEYWRAFKLHGRRV